MLGGARSSSEYVSENSGYDLFLALVNALKEADPSSTTFIEPGTTPIGRPDIGLSTAEAPARGGTAARRQQCCFKCYARDQEVTGCLTLDPASMRKQIAGNQKGCCST